MSESDFLLAIAAMVMVIVYLIPLFIAHNRNHKHKEAIAALNIFGGWTGIGWLVALVWSLT